MLRCWKNKCKVWKVCNEAYGAQPPPCGRGLEGSTGFVYRRSEQNLWTVGHYDPIGTWYPESDHHEPDSAAARIHYLNGGKNDTD